MTKYRLSDKVLLQRNARVPKETSILELIESRSEQGVEAGTATDGAPAATADGTPTAITAQDLDPEAIYLALSVDGKHHVLNLSASLILERLLLGDTPETIREIITGVFDVDASQAALDIEATIETLAEKGFVTTDR